MKSIAILQPGYLPWLGFFEQMALVDTFVYLDDVQYTKQDWRNRNRILTKTGIQFLTVPVSVKSTHQKILETKITQDSKWQKKHLNLIKASYQKSEYFDLVFSILAKTLLQKFEYLIDLDVALVEQINSLLDIKTKIVFSSQISKPDQDKNLKLLEICKSQNATLFYDGAAAKSFIDTKLFKNHGITMCFQDYKHPEYPQFKTDFVPYLSIVDLLFHKGNLALKTLLKNSKPLSSLNLKKESL